MFAFPRIDKSKFGLYPVVDDVSWIEVLLKLDVKTIQLRIKNPDQADLEQQIIKAIRLGREYDAQVFINDNWKLAIKHKAFGIHLGQEDIEVADLQAISDANICLGLSTHDDRELLKVKALNPSYLALGHIFPTPTKDMPSQPQGLINLAKNQLLAGATPTVAIGGIDLSVAEDVWQTGVDSIAVVRAITQAEDIHQAIYQFNAIIAKPRKVNQQEVIHE
ncbi:thiamine phosphate synthase [Aliivibrio sp. S4TY2]|nr:MULTISPECIES: thiamine phosphate synthase [unclassified Aliivibrio]MDD9156118.1 thiamine phosphate synthase [Aliivibrio sp. S4TY2]MDD9159827.1 thiamine phosphate synthase [Aliivibrio sp. S4TY1]MDD9163825.1 thiamine phosphate synthase [Aliivibrio sp. S4MY2]MDD9167827.1 thiamine phosphate synthase [Aliivibrio sp. S4MY4]MDD9185509.1 thiamine phosphate synthase [Aliivibrio sp. S4MY3]